VKLVLAAALVVLLASVGLIARPDHPGQQQVHVATRSYPVRVTIARGIGNIPCFLICTQLQLTGSGSDDAILDLSAVSGSDVTVDTSTSTATVRLAAPFIGPAVLDTADSDITSSDGSRAGPGRGPHR
jgi:hypothetical protein